VLHVQMYLAELRRIQQQNYQEQQQMQEKLQRDPQYTVRFNVSLVLKAEFISMSVDE